MESVRAARGLIAFRNLGRWERFRWDRSNPVVGGRCRARRALVECYDTRARPFTRPKGWLRATGQNHVSRARDEWFRYLWKFFGQSAS
jgi:hypothetical protein